MTKQTENETTKPEELADIELDQVQGGTAAKDIGIPRGGKSVSTKGIADDAKPGDGKSFFDEADS